MAANIQFFLQFFIFLQLVYLASTPLLSLKGL